VGVAGRFQHEGGPGTLALPHVEAECGRHGCLRLDQNAYVCWVDVDT
jgi:hypothetical protein